MAARRGPIEGEHVIGVDRDPASRPGVPRHAPPADVADSPDHPPSEQESARDTKLIRTELDEPTPVFGSAQPPRGLSGVLRKAAYEIPEHHARHWMMLLLADRVDALEDRVGDLLARPLELGGARDAAATVRANPAPALLAGVGALWLARRTLRG